MGGSLRLPVSFDGSNHLLYSKVTTGGPRVRRCLCHRLEDSSMMNVYAIIWVQMPGAPSVETYLSEGWTPATYLGNLNFDLSL